MRVAVISDIHANLHALQAVLEEIDRDPPDEIWCLGDLVGYGPRPNEVTEIVRDRADICLVGNHDLAVLGSVDIADFSEDAAAAARWTERVLDEEARDYLATLSPTGAAEGVELYHGSPRDPVWEYVLSGEAALASLELASAPVVLIGHSHVALAIVLNEGELAGGLAPGGTEADLKTGRWLLNPGSVGQPRDGDPDAAYLELDLDVGRATFRRVEYPVAVTQKEMREEGLPSALAERLAGGM